MVSLACLVGGIALCMGQPGANLLGPNGAQSQGAIDSRQFQNQIREGNTIVATEFFRLNYEVSVEIVPIDAYDIENIKPVVIWNECQGGDHANHAACDLSCCKPDRKNHDFNMTGKYVPYRDAMNQATAQANALAVRGGGTVSPDDWSHRTSQALANMRREANRSRRITVAKFNDPCAKTVRLFGRKGHDVIVRGVMRKSGIRRSRGVDTPINEEVGRHEQTVATVYIPDPEPYDSRTDVICKCPKPKQEPPKRLALQIPGPPITESDDPEEIVKNYLCGFRLNEIQTALENQQPCMVPPGGLEYECTGVDLNTCEFTFVNNCDQDLYAGIPPGTCLDSVDDSIQDMVINTRLWVPVMANSEVTVIASISPTASLIAASTRWTCLNIDKKQPRPGSKFRIRPQTDDGQVALAMRTSLSRFKGPHDQARMWIYTDKAPIQKINNVLIPGVTEGRYMELLRDVDGLCGVDIGGKDWRKVWDPALLNATTNQPEAMTWFLSRFASIDAKAAAAALKGQGKNLATKAAADAKAGPGTIVAFLRGAAESGDPAVAMAALDVADSNAKALMTHGAAFGEGLASLILLSDAQVTVRAMDIALKHRVTAAGPAIASQIDGGSNDVVRAKAKSVAAGLGVSMPAEAGPGSPLR